MAMKGLSLDGANKLKAAVDTYIKEIKESMFVRYGGSMGYGSNNEIAKIIDNIGHEAFVMGINSQSTFKKYQDELNDVINTYKSFDNTGSGTLGKIVPKNTTAKKS